MRINFSEVRMLIQFTRIASSKSLGHNGPVHWCFNNGRHIIELCLVIIYSISLIYKCFYLQMSSDLAWS